MVNVHILKKPNTKLRITKHSNSLLDFHGVYFFLCNREIRLDINVLNHEGNVADCAGVAGLAALAHFKRPDVTLEENVVTV